ncbi:MAG: DUF5103 domain-containing protein [Balneolaceae bacterium]|nr:MAG: DUF5103 domain-containing protein [Balneolaceae bacterium]
MKGNTISDPLFQKKALFLSQIAVFLILNACTLFETTGSYTEPLPQVQGIENLFNVPGQIVTDSQIHSIQFHRGGNSSNAPIIELNSNQRLNLLFEVLQFESRQFSVHISHHNPDWSRSSIGRESYIDGLFTVYMDAGRVSSVRQPQYRQYGFEFPNDDLRILKSGNYMLSVEDADTGYLVMALPFFVTENQGSITSSVEQLITPRQNLRSTHRPVSRYRLPDFVDQPQFDLEFYFVQNRFWGRSEKASELDFSSPEEVHYEMDRNSPFIGDYEFLELNLSDLTQRNPQVLEFIPAEVPPKVILFDDVSGFSASGRLTGAGNFGRPVMSLNAQYANAQFTFDANLNPDEDLEIYLTGDFNNWAIQSANRLIYNEESDRWHTSKILKEGMYRYKYVVMENSRVDDLFFDDLFTNTRQEYHTFVYMRDSREFYYRLLQFNHFFSN